MTIYLVFLIAGGWSATARMDLPGITFTFVLSVCLHTNRRLSKKNINEWTFYGLNYWQQCVLARVPGQIQHYFWNKEYFWDWRSDRLKVRSGLSGSDTFFTQWARKEKMSIRITRTCCRRKYFQEKFAQHRQILELWPVPTFKGNESSDWFVNWSLVMFNHSLCVLN